MQVEWTGRRIVSGQAIGPALVSRTPISFLGDVDIRTGRIVGASTDIVGQDLTGCVLIVPATRGSAGAWRFLYQLYKHGTHPVAILTQDMPDPSVVQGAILAKIPIVALVADKISDAVSPGTRLEVRDGKVRLVATRSH